MKVLVQTRTAGELDWTKGIVELSRLPTVGECVSAVVGDGQERAWHTVRSVTHFADGTDYDAVLFCNRVGDEAMRRLMYAETSTGRRVEATDGPPALPLLLTISQAAKAAQVSVRTIRRKLESGELTGVDFGTSGKRRDWRITFESLANMGTTSAARERPAPAPPSERWSGTNPLGSGSSPQPERRRRAPPVPSRTPTKHGKDGKFLPRPEQKRGFKAWP